MLIHELRFVLGEEAFWGRLASKAPKQVPVPSILLDPIPSIETSGSMEFPKGTPPVEVVRPPSEAPRTDVLAREMIHITTGGITLAGTDSAAPDAVVGPPLLPSSASKSLAHPRERK
jgi:hypothetical protein